MGCPPGEQQGGKPAGPLCRRVASVCQAWVGLRTHLTSPSWPPAASSSGCMPSHCAGQGLHRHRAAAEAPAPQSLHPAAQVSCGERCQDAPTVGATAATLPCRPRRNQLSLPPPPHLGLAAPSLTRAARWLTCWLRRAAQQRSSASCPPSQSSRACRWLCRWPAPPAPSPLHERLALCPGASRAPHHPAYPRIQPCPGVHCALSAR